MAEMSTCPEPEGIIALHAAAVCVEGGAVLFLGPPNTGKSTVRRMLAEHTPSLADDGVYIVVSQTHWAVAQAEHRPFFRPLAQKEVKHLVTFPLKAIFRLYQSPSPRIKRIETLLICRYLVDAFFEITRQRNYNVLTKQLIFANLAKVARVIPGYEFYFNCTPLTSGIFFKVLKETVISYS